ncbi:hypothetical protein C8F04DRAFT_1233615 [Mycena alexandri]|uniref:Uncharacterized protein n=1 Tax=Mycena alexandri TaxID=1745969 RepID=A0AAD6SXY6_9AGAR|nr:hypothetical protein C8F04DRAFT_1233615 [Mycena alexandri]
MGVLFQIALEIARTLFVIFVVVPAVLPPLLLVLDPTYQTLLSHSRRLELGTYTRRLLLGEGTDTSPDRPLFLVPVLLFLYFLFIRGQNRNPAADHHGPQSGLAQVARLLVLRCLLPFVFLLTLAAILYLFTSPEPDILGDLRLGFEYVRTAISALDIRRPTTAVDLWHDFFPEFHFALRTALDHTIRDLSALFTHKIMARVYLWRDHGLALAAPGFIYISKYVTVVVAGLAAIMAVRAVVIAVAGLPATTRAIQSLGEKIIFAPLKQQAFSASCAASCWVAGYIRPEVHLFFSAIFCSLGVPALLWYIRYWRFVSLPHVVLVLVVLALSRCALHAFSKPKRTPSLELPSRTGRRSFPYQAYTVQSWPITHASPYTSPPAVLIWNHSPFLLMANPLFVTWWNFVLFMQLIPMVWTRRRAGIPTGLGFIPNNWPRARPPVLPTPPVALWRCRKCFNTPIPRAEPYFPLDASLLAVLVKCSRCNKPMLRAKDLLAPTLIQEPVNPPAQHPADLNSGAEVGIEVAKAETAEDAEGVEVPYASADCTPAEELPEAPGSNMRASSSVSRSEDDEPGDNGVGGSWQSLSRRFLTIFSEISSRAGSLSASSASVQSTPADSLTGEWPNITPIASPSSRALWTQQVDSGGVSDFQSNRALLVVAGQDNAGAESVRVSQVQAKARKWDFRDCTSTCWNPDCRGECIKEDMLL